MASLCRTKVIARYVKVCYTILNLGLMLWNGSIYDIEAKLQHKCEGTRREQLWKYYITVREAKEHL